MTIDTQTIRAALAADVAANPSLRMVFLNRAAVAALLDEVERLRAGREVEQTMLRNAAARLTAAEKVVAAVSPVVARLVRGERPMYADIDESRTALDEWEASRG